MYNTRMLQELFVAKECQRKASKSTRDAVEVCIDTQ